MVVPTAQLSVCKDLVSDGVGGSSMKSEIRIVWVVVEDDGTEHQRTFMTFEQDFADSPPLPSFFGPEPWVIRK
jgi:hypothetical protein